MNGVAVAHLLAGTGSGRPLALADHLDLHGELPRLGARELIEELAQAGLTGRGGAGYPTARKLAVVASRSGEKGVIANGAETEPMSQKDRVLVGLTPHLVLDGLEIAANAIGAKMRVVAVSAGYAPTLQAAVAERGARDVSVVTLPAGYLAGQETALVSAIAGGPLKPRVVPPFPAEEGLRRRPTLIQNVETFAHIALIARHGVGWFRDGGSEASPGSVLVTLGGAIDRPGVYEVRGGSRLGDVIDMAGGVRGELRAVLLGGYFGRWLAPQARDMRLDATRLVRHGATLGTGVIVALDDAHCPVAEVTRVTAWMASQSAGQCGPCSHGLPAMAGELIAIMRGQAHKNSLRLLQRWGGMVQRRGACHHPDGTARFVLSALEVFHDEFRSHERHGPCALCNAPAALRVPGEERLAA